MELLALHGGRPTRTEPFGSGKRFGEEEAKELLEALEQNTLFYYFGGKVNAFLSDFNKIYGTKYSVATSSGTAAIHVALGAAGVTVGDEVITSPITDQGTLIGILYQNAIPVFADVDPHTYNMDPTSIEAKITERTKAIVVVHLAGNPADMDAIMAVAKKHRIKVIEDCAQSYLSQYKGKYVGTIGDYGCFSTNDFKHISTGDGGIVTINSEDEEDYHFTHAFADKNYRRDRGETYRDVEMLAPNYRMTELQGAVGVAQLKKLRWICETRTRHGDRISEGLSGVPGIAVPKVQEGCASTYFSYMLRLNGEELTCTRAEFCQALDAEGIPNMPGYIPDVVYMTRLFQNRTAYPGSHFPFDLNGTTYERGLCPIAEQVLQTSVSIGISEFYSERDIEDIITGVRKVALYYSKR
ncbi:DegT/DnrJ/EryC1/StrS family aminotransferase [Cohnella soli]|uniref:DegT/DnrJ/EryC1/StrS family aminotransferase n=1 Tax=Cohnella soli TaxID=425005 RepID=A0ABW0I4P8_9BACL